MPSSCCVYACTNRHDRQKTIRFYRIPRWKHQRRAFVRAINRQDWYPTEASRVCSEHFVSGFINPDPNNVDFAPTVFKNQEQKLTASQPSRSELTHRENTVQFVKSRLLQVSSTVKETRQRKVYAEGSLDSKEVQTWESLIFKDESSQANLVRHPLCDPALIGEYSHCKDHPLPDIFRSAIVCINKFTDLTFSFHLWQEGLPTYMEITRVGWYGTPCLGQVPAKVTLSSGGQMHFVVLCAKPVICNVQKENGDFNVKYFSEFLFKLSKCSKNMWCSGLPPKESDKGRPWTRKQSKDCKVYFKATVRNTSKVEGIGRCPACSRKKNSLAASARKLIPGFREKRVQKDSRCPIASLSPDSKRKRLENYRKKEDDLKKKLAALTFELQDQDGTCIRRNVSGAGELDLDCTTEVHSGENSCDSDTSDWTDESEPDVNDQQRCQICQRTFKGELSLRKHLRVHQSNQPANKLACDMGSVQRRVQTHSDSLGQHQVKTDVLLDVISMVM